MELLANKYGNMFYCQKHNMFTLNYSFISLAFYPKSLETLLSKLEALSVNQKRDQLALLYFNGTGFRLNLSKKDLNELIYIVEGGFCAYKALELVVS